MPRGGKQRYAWSWRDIKPAAARSKEAAAKAGSCAEPAFPPRCLPLPAADSRFGGYPPIRPMPPRAQAAPASEPREDCRRTWTDAQERLLRELVADGRSSGEIAARLNMSRGAIVGKCDRLDLQLKGGARPKVARLRAHGDRPAMPWPPRSWTPSRKLPPVFTPPEDTEAEPPAIAASEPEIRVDAEPVNPGGLAIMELTHSSCRWPIDPPAGGEWRFCGQPREARSTLSCYCTAHWQASRSRAAGWRKAARP
jgi:hypothetical protein